MNQIHTHATHRNALAGCYHQSKFCILCHVASHIFSHAEVYYSYSPYWLKVLRMWSCGMWCCVIYLAVQPHIQEDHSLYVHHNENLVSHVEIIVWKTGGCCGLQLSDWVVWFLWEHHVMYTILITGVELKEDVLWSTLLQHDAKQQHTFFMAVLGTQMSLCVIPCRRMLSFSCNLCIQSNGKVLNLANIVADTSHVHWTHQIVEALVVYVSLKYLILRSLDQIM